MNNQHYCEMREATLAIPQTTLKAVVFNLMRAIARDGMKPFEEQQQWLMTQARNRGYSELQAEGIAVLTMQQYLGA